MKIVDRLEDTLGGKYAGLFAEVVTFDSYKVKELNFIPTVVIDLGANVGAFTRFARELFPDALIVSVEPDSENFYHLRKFTEENNIKFIHEAVGDGFIVKRVDPNAMINGAHASYLPETIVDEKSEYPLEDFGIAAIMLNRLFEDFVKPTDKVLVKIDVEGAEFCMFYHEPTLLCLEQADYFAFELHHEMEYYSEQEKVIKRKQVSDFIIRLSKTHSIIHEQPMLFGTKK